MITVTVLNFEVFVVTRHFLFSPHWAPISQSQSEAKIEVSFPQEEKVASW